MSQADSQDSLARLQETIAQLQAIANSLATEEVTLSETVLNNLVADTAQLVVALETKPETSETVPEAIANEDDWDSELLAESEPVATTQPRSEPPMKRRSAQPWWQDQKLIAGVLSVAIVLIFIWRLTTQAPEPEIIAEQPNDGSTPIETVVTDEPTVTLGDEPVAIEETPEPEVVAPEPEPVAPEPIVPAPLTPEQRLIAAIQGQVDDLTQPYGDNLVRGVEANFATGVLSITVGDAWYLLKAGLQDRLGADVLELSQLLDFRKLRIKDLEGNFVAREPVVGEKLVIYRRYQQFPELEKAS